MNPQIRQDKQARKERGLVMKQKDRPRSFLTKLDTLYMTRDYYYDKVNESHVCILDKVIGIPAYERITGGVSAKLVSLATEVSYAKSAQFGAVDAISRQSVRNKILKLGALEKRPDPKEEKRDVKELHVFAADGGKWIKSGLENFAQRKMVIDGYHFEKSLKKLANLFPKKNVRQRIHKALEKDDRKRAD